MADRPKLHAYQVACFCQLDGADVKNHSLASLPSYEAENGESLGLSSQPSPTWPQQNEILVMYDGANGWNVGSPSLEIFWSFS
jgi:hypothetical protein